MQIIKKHKFGCDDLKCFVITEFFIQDGEDLTPYKSPEYQEIFNDIDISVYPDFIQSQINTFKNK